MIFSNPHHFIFYRTMSSSIAPDVGLIRNLLLQIQKSILMKTNDAVNIPPLLNLINMWSACIPAVVDNREASDLVFQYRNEVLKGWVDASPNRPALNSIPAVIAFRSLVQDIMDYQANLKDSKEGKKPVVRSFYLFSNPPF
jgi:hypothetical protein